LAAVFFAAFLAVAMGLLPVCVCERALKPIGLKQFPSCHGYRFIAADYTAFSLVARAF